MHTIQTCFTATPHPHVHSPPPPPPKDDGSGVFCNRGVLQMTVPPP